MSEIGDLVSPFSRRQGRRRSSKFMVPERDSNTIEESQQSQVFSLRPRILNPRRGITKEPEETPERLTGKLVTTSAETHTVRSPEIFTGGSPASTDGTPVSSIQSNRTDLQSDQTENEVRSKKERKHGRIPADTPERQAISSEDETLRSAESMEKEKSPVDEYLAITMNSTPGESRQPSEDKEITEELKKAKSKPSLFKKWTKKMADSFSKSSTEKPEIDEEKLVEGEVEVMELGTLSVAVEDEVKPKRKGKKMRKGGGDAPAPTVTPEVKTVSPLPSHREAQSAKRKSPPLSREAPPLSSQSSPVTREAPPLPREAPPLSSQSSPVTREIPPVTREIPPVTVRTVPHRSKKRNLRRREKGGEFGPNAKILGIKIHHTDLLPTDPNICHPVVRITIMTQDGNYLIKSCYQPEGEGQAWQTESKMTKHCLEQVMTRPISLNESGFYRLLPKWEEMLVIPEPLEKFLNNNTQVIFFFEIMDFVPMGHQSLQKRNKRQVDLGWHKIAWAFLKPLGGNGTRHVNRRLRLQLYRPDFGKGPNVLSWWLSKRCNKLNSTLYVTVKGILPPEPEHKSPQSNLSTLLSMRKSELTEALIEGQLALGQKSTSRESQGSSNQRIRNAPQWKRFPGQSCKVPNKLLMSLPVSEIDSLNFRVTGNVQCVNFSPCGILLAAGLDTERYHVVLIFEIPSGRLLKSLRGHHGLIYELDWNQLTASSYMLASASADSTARVWRIEMDDSDLTATLLRILLHPSYVYTLNFSPTDSRILATGGYEAVIRIWKVKDVIPAEETQVEQSSPLFLLTAHSSHINSVRFHPSGEFLFSGDGKGKLCEWKIFRGKQAPILEKETKLVSFGHVAITSLCLDATGRKLLVQLCRSCLKILDVETFLVLNAFQGLVNERLRLQSTLSPCGNLVLSGSEDSAFYVWDSDTGRLLSQIQITDHPNCVVSSVTYHPFDHYVAIGLLSSTNEPHPILLYTFEYPPGISIGTISKLKTTFSRSRSSQESSAEEKIDKIQQSGSDNFKQRHIDMSQKFQSILQKLDEVTGGVPQMATVTNQLMDENRLIHITDTDKPV